MDETVLKRPRMLICFLALMLWGTSLAAQNTPPVSEEYLLIRAIDGNLYIGRLLRMDSAAVVLQTEAFPELVIPRSSIKRMGEAKKRPLNMTFAAGEAAIAGAYFVNGSAYGPHTGEAYYSTAMLFFHQGTYGLSEHFSIRIGAFFDFEGFYLPSWVAPKLSIPIRENFLQVALEGMLGRGFDNFEDFENEAHLSAMQALITVGNRTTNLTFGGGFSWRDRKWSQQPFFSVSGTAQVSSHFALMTENYSFVAYGSRGHLSAFGGRFYWRKVNLDLAVAISREELGDVFLFPWVGMSVNFY